MLLALNKPFGHLSQFTPDHPGQKTLSSLQIPKNVYPLGRLDRDSEGLLLLSDETGLNNQLLNPQNAHPRTYWVQVEGEITEGALAELSTGVIIQGRTTLPATAKEIHPILAPRQPPIRDRQNIPTSWISLELRQGRNRQVRKMTAAVGFPTLRLIRVGIGQFQLPSSLSPGTWYSLSGQERNKVFQFNQVRQG